MKDLHIIWATDNPFAPILAVSMLSFLETNRDTTNHLYILDDNLSEENRDKLIRVAAPFGTEPIFLRVGERLEDLKKLRFPDWQGSFTAYARLFLPQLLPPDVDRILYVDCDTVFCGSVEELCDFDLHGCVCAGVIDPFVKIYKQETLGFAPEDPYFNSGILLIDCEEFRKQNVLETAVQTGVKESFSYVDQDLINTVLKGRIALLPFRFNVIALFSLMMHGTTPAKTYAAAFYPPEELRAAVKHPTILHFAGQNPPRPWKGGLYEKHKWVALLKRTPFADLPLPSLREVAGFLRRIRTILYRLGFHRFVARWEIHKQRRVSRPI